MAEPGCATCAWRAKYDAKPKSLLGRLWRWHAGWCPGFKKYITSLPEEERVALAKKYGMKKYADNGGQEDEGQEDGSMSDAAS